MPTIDAFSGAENSVDAQKRALLSAVAQQGDAGRSAYDAQRAAAQQSQQAAVSRVYGSDAATANKTMAAEAARAQSANSTYMDQVRAAVPLSRQLADSYQADALHEQQQAAEARRQEIADRDQARRWNLEDRNYTQSTRQTERQMMMEDRAYELAQRTAKEAEGGNPLANLVERLGGADLARTQLIAVAEQALAQAQPRPGQSQTRVLGHRILPTIPRLSAAQRSQVLDGLGEELGLPSGVLASFLGNRNPARATPSAVDNVMASPKYVSEVGEANAGVAELMEEGGFSEEDARAEVIKQIRSDLAGAPVLRDAVIRAIRNG